MLKTNNEYEITYYKKDNFVDFHKIINEIIPQKSKNAKNTLKYKNYLYIISGTVHQKKRLTIKLDDGNLFISKLNKERISDITDEIQHYCEYIETDADNKWYRVDEFDFNNWFSDTIDNYLYFSNKTKFNYGNFDFTIREDNTFFIDIVNMKIAKQVQYIEFESCSESNINNKLEFFKQKMQKELGFSPINLDYSKLSLCKSIKECKIPNNIDDFRNLFFSIFDLVYFELLDL